MIPKPDDAARSDCHGFLAQIEHAVGFGAFVEEIAAESSELQVVRIVRPPDPGVQIVVRLQIKRVLDIGGTAPGKLILHTKG